LTEEEDEEALQKLFTSSFNAGGSLDGGLTWPTPLKGVGELGFQARRQRRRQQQQQQ